MEMYDGSAAVANQLDDNEEDKPDRIYLHEVWCTFSLRTGTYWFTGSVGDKIYVDDETMDILLKIGRRDILLSGLLDVYGTRYYKEGLAFIKVCKIIDLNDNTNYLDINHDNM